MSDLDEIRKKRLEELMRPQQEKSQQKVQENAQIQQQIELMENTVKQFFTKEALSRYGTLKTAHQEKALQLLVILYQAIQSGQIKSEIDDSVLKKLLQQMEPKKRDIKINRV